MISFTVEVNSSPEKIWPFYEDISKRKQWEEDLEYLNFDGDFVEGTKGKMKLRGLPELEVELLEVVENKKYSDRTVLPNGDEVRFIHELEFFEGVTKMTHQVFIWKKDGKMSKEDLPMLMGIFADVPASMYKIKELVEG